MVATVQTGERHFELLEGLLAELDGYSGELDRELIVRAFTFAAADVNANRKSTRLNSSHRCISYAVFCLKKKKKNKKQMKSSHTRTNSLRAGTTLHIVR